MSRKKKGKKTKVRPYSRKKDGRIENVRGHTREHGGRELHEMTDADFDGMSLTWRGWDKRKDNLYALQDVNRDKLIDFLEEIGYEIIDTDRVDSGWGDGLMLDKFRLKDKRTGKILDNWFVGNEDNSAIFEQYKSGGKGLWKSVPGAKSLREIEGGE